MSAPFTLDTSGVIGVPGPMERKLYTWRDLDPFTQGYVEAMFAGLATSIVPPGCGYPPGMAFSDLAPETLALILRDCAEWQLASNMGADLGRNFWVARQSAFVEVVQHGSLRDRLHKSFPPLTPYLGDDGKVYLR